MIFRAIALKFEFEARETLRFPAGKAGNTFRGALGHALPDEVFAPRDDGNGPSGFADRPRPFVLRAGHLDGRRFSAGERFDLTINTFDQRIAAPEVFQAAFEGLGNSGLGPDRAPVELLDASRAGAIEIALNPPFEPVARIRVEFLTPTELKFGGTVLREPRFEPLFARVRDRVARFCDAEDSNDVDYRALGERARHVTTAALRLNRTEIERRSSRTGQRHGIGGFIGEAEYAGDLGEFLPWLKAAEWTGVGRYTVWGNGALRVRTLARIAGDHVPIEPDARSGGDAVLRNSET